MLGRNSPGLLHGFRHAGFFAKQDERRSSGPTGRQKAARRCSAKRRGFLMPAMVLGRSRAQDAGHDVNRALTMPGR